MPSQFQRVFSVFVTTISLLDLFQGGSDHFVTALALPRVSFRPTTRQLLRQTERRQTERWQPQNQRVAGIGLQDSYPTGVNFDNDGVALSRRLFSSRQLLQRQRTHLVSLAATSLPSSEAAEDAASQLPSQQFSKRVLIARIVLGFSLVYLGYQLGLTSTPSRSVVANARASPRRVKVLSALLIFLLARDVWRSIPSWAKPSLIRRAIVDTRRLLGLPASLLSTSRESRNLKRGTEMSNLGTLGGKLESVWKVVQRRIPPESLKEINLQASILGLWQAFQDQKRIEGSREPTDNLDTATLSPRGQLYANCGETATSNDLEGLEEWMELADAAYDELPDQESLQSFLQRKKYKLLKHDKTLVPGYLGHYVAIHESTKEAVIGIKGTSGLEDLITDMCGAALPYQLDLSTDTDTTAIGTTGSMKTIRAHEGIWLSSKRLAEDLQPLVERLLLPQDYHITVVGHSLGAASAALVSVLLRANIPALNTDRLQVYAFASPPVLDLATAQECEAFVTTIVNNGDVITRCNAGPVLVTIEMLKKMHGRLQEVLPSTSKGLVSEGPSKASQPVGLGPTLRLLQKLQQQRKQEAQLGNTPDGESRLISSSDFATAIEQAIDTVGDNDHDQLYVAGKVLLLCQENDSSSVAREGDNDNAPLVPVETRSTTRAILTNPTAQVLRYLELDKRMLDDHMAPSYKASLKSLRMDKD